MASNKPFHRPDQQGRLDGMCGVYATINSVKYLFDHSEKQDSSLFEHLCKKGHALFPKIMYNGIGMQDLRRVLGYATEWVATTHPEYRLQWSAPLYRKKFPHIEDYFSHLRNQLDCYPNPETLEDSATWIVGLNVPWDHWTCVRAMSDKLAYFYDSYGMGRYRRESFTLRKSEAGEGKGKKILVDQHQSFLLVKTRVDRHPVMTDAASHGDGRVN